MVSMLQMLQTEDGMRREAFTIVTKCFGMAHSTVHCLWNTCIPQATLFLWNFIPTKKLGIVEPNFFCVCIRMVCASTREVQFPCIVLGV